MIDLATDGIRGTMTRQEVILATRRVMLSACRAGWTWADVHALLTDTSRRRLAKQISTGPGDRPFSRTATTQLLLKLWADVETTAATGPAWDQDAVRVFLSRAQVALDAAELRPLDRAVMGVVLDLAHHHETTRPAVPVRTVADLLGIDKNRAHTTLRRLCADGTWLALAKRGDKKRANLYTLAPALRGAGETTDKQATSTPPTPAHTPAPAPAPVISLDRARRARSNHNARGP